MVNKPRSLSKTKKKCFLPLTICDNKKITMPYLAVMISTVDTTQIGATRPGPDTEVGMCREALKQ